MGRVFSAVDVRSGHRVAIKTLVSRDAVGIEYFRREIETLSTLRHPAIVPFREHGENEGLPWYAMDLLEGYTLRDALEAHKGLAPASTARESWVPTSGVRRHDSGSDASAQLDRSRRVLELESRYISAEEQLRICAKILEALDHVHARGLVHADIKPENILLRDDLQPILIDFGLASCFDAPRERLAIVPRSLGSVAYMAPERLKGALPDARADLYAMGCILYECLTGRHPFLRSTIEATTLAHLRHEVVAPSSFRPQIPRQLDALVLRLLAKLADDRLGYAKYALEVLSDGQVEGTPESAFPPSSNYLYRPPLVGRSLPLTRLRTALDAAGAGQGASIVVSAASGLGKTRLVLELVELALQRAAKVFHLECAAPAEASLQPWLQPLQALLRMLSEQRDPGSEGGTTDDLRQLLDTLAVDETASTAKADARARARERLLQGLVATLHDLCETSVVLLVVDDVERADDLTVELVERLVQAGTASKRLLVLLTQGAAAQSEPLQQACEPLLLDPLSEAEVEVMVRSMLAVDFPSPNLIQQAHRVCEGNPGILGHYLRTLVSAGVLRRNRHLGWHLSSPLEAESARKDRVRLEEVPVATLSAVFEWRLSSLSPEELHLATVSCLLDTSFDLTTLAMVARAALTETEATAAALCRHNVLERQPAGRYRFTHQLLGRLLLGRHELERTPHLSRRAAAVLWKHRGRDIASPGVLAARLSRCGSRKKAADCFALAANDYMRAYRRQDALASLRAAVSELLRTPDGIRRFSRQLAELYEQTGDVALELRRYGEAQEAYRQSLPLANDAKVTVARLHRKLAGAFQRDHERAHTHLQAAIAALESADHSHPEYRSEWMQVNLDAMWVHYWKQETASLLTIAESILPEVERFGTERQRASLHFNVSVGLMQRNRYVTGSAEREHVDEALRLYEALDSRPNVAMCRFVRSMILLFSGDLGQAEAGFEGILAISEKATSVTIRIRALTFLCILHRKQRNHERVRKLATAVYSLAAEHDMLEYQGTAMANLAWIAFHDGALSECERLARAAVEAWNASPLNVFRWTGLLPLMAALLSRPAKPSDAQELVEIAESLLHGSQQLLPETLNQHLDRLRVDGESSVVKAREHAQLAIDSAKELRLI